MAAKERTKMPVSERAKQFAPFSPLDRLGEALRKAEEEVERESEELMLHIKADE